MQKDIVNCHASVALNDALNKTAEVVGVNHLNTEVFEMAHLTERHNAIAIVSARCAANTAKEGNAPKERRKENAEHLRCQMCA